MQISKGDNWRIWWGQMPLPKGAEAIGTIKTEHGQGALIQLENGIFVQGNAGAIRNLPQRQVQELM